MEWGAKGMNGGVGVGEASNADLKLSSMRLNQAPTKTTVKILCPVNLVRKFLRCALSLSLSLCTVGSGLRADWPPKIYFCTGRSNVLKPAAGGKEMRTRGKNCLKVRRSATEKKEEEKESFSTARKEHGPATYKCMSMICYYIYIYNVFGFSNTDMNL
jgi:hypothetical protein